MNLMADFRTRTVLVIGLAVGAAALHGQSGALASVDPMIGTANEGNTYPGATLPFGMIQWSPDTSQNFYYYQDKALRGFSLTHLSGAGCPVFGDFPIMPMSAKPGDKRPDKPETATFDHSKETAQAGYYSLVLADGTRVELTVSDRSGMARLIYPKGQRAGLLVNGAGSASSDVHMPILPPVGREKDAESLTYAADGSLEGVVTAGGFCGTPTKYTLYAAFEFKNKPVRHALWKNGAVVSSDKADGKRAVAWVDLGEQSTQVVKVGLSYVSEANAKANLKAELPGGILMLRGSKRRGDG